MQDLIKKLHPLERAVLPLLQKHTNLQDITKASKLQEIEVMRALQWLENKKVLTINKQEKTMINLDKNGLDYKSHGLPEITFLKSLTTQFQPLSKIAKTSKLDPGELNASLGLCKQKQSIEIQKNKELELKITTKGKNSLKSSSPEQNFLKKSFPLNPEKLTKQEQLILKDLRKRKSLLTLSTNKTMTISLTPLGKTLSKQKISQNVVNRLTSAMLKDRSWKSKDFREYDVEINVPQISGGRRHPYSESLNIIRNIFLEMGFQEMRGPWVETAFWGMDSMWIPQDHPAREAQDTFYLDRKGNLPDKALLKKIKAAHENGFNTGSTGHTKEWKEDLASELILRQHSTSTTFRYFHKLKLNHNCKYFYIANNFRNEAVDATHLPEFGQAEGFIMGDNLSLADLMGFVREFYAKLGITKIRFKPTFNPYTEPSMEAHYYNEKLGKWYSLINSGIFRPEALAPYGITKSVIAWGMGSSRIAAILTGKAKLREVLGPEVDFQWIRQHKRIGTD